VTSVFGWRYIFGVLAAIGVFVLVAVARLVRGTKGPDRSISLHPSKIALGYLRVFKVPRFLVFSATAMAGTGGLFTYIAGSPFVFISLFGLTATQYSWAFGTNALLYVIGSQANRAILKNHESGWILLMVTAAECAITAVLLGGSLLGFLPPWAFMTLVAFYMFCHAFVGPNAGALALLPFSRDVGSASASFASAQMLSGALASGLLAFFYNGTGVPMAAMMGTCSGLSLVLAGVGSLSMRRVR
jgi:DHA1 family bicyclomycin/chloramphenicol resistance-like MFS transporter